MLSDNDDNVIFYWTSIILITIPHTSTAQTMISVLPNYQPIPGDTTVLDSRTFVRCTDREDYNGFTLVFIKNTYIHCVVSLVQNYTGITGLRKVVLDGHQLTIVSRIPSTRN